MATFPSITAVTFNFASNADPLGSPWNGNTPSGNTTNLLKSASGVVSKNQPSGTGFGAQVLSTSYGPDMEAWLKLPTITATSGQEIFALFLRLQQDGASTVDGYVVYANLAAGTDTWAVERYVNNSGSQTGISTPNGSQNIAAGDYVGAKVEDSGGNPVITAYWCPAASDPTVSGNWTAVITATDSNAAKITGTGRFALEFQGTVTTGDDLRVGTVVAGGDAEEHDQDDTITGTDARTSTVGKTQADTITGTDATAKALTKAIADTAGIADDLDTSTAGEHEQPVDDTASVTDAQARTVGKRPADTASVTDAQAKTLTKALADTAEVTDTGLAQESDYTHQIDDALSIDDSFDTGGDQAFEQDEDDTATVTDATAKALSKAIADTIAGTDARAKTAGKTVADTATLADNTSATGDIAHTHEIDDAIQGADALTREWEALLELAETPTVTDSVDTDWSGELRAWTYTHAADWTYEPDTDWTYTPVNG